MGAKLRQIRRLTAHESGFLKQHAPGPFKITIPGALSRALGWYKPGLTDKFYPTLAESQDIVDILRREVQALIDEGVSYVQLDSLRYVIQLADSRTREQMLQAGQDLDKALDETIAADNATLQGQCRSDRGPPHVPGQQPQRLENTGGYEVIAEKAFNLLEVDRFLLEYDTERAGGFEPLRFVPPGKMVVLGLISSKDPQLESQDQLLRRIDEAAQYVPIERLALSPQCGFASTAPGNLLTWDEQRRKLELVAETARQVWGAAPG